MYYELGEIMSQCPFRAVSMVPQSNVEAPEYIESVKGAVFVQQEYCLWFCWLGMALKKPFISLLDCVSVLDGEKNENFVMYSSLEHFYQYSPFFHLSWALNPAMGCKWDLWLPVLSRPDAVEIRANLGLFLLKGTERGEGSSD